MSEPKTSIPKFASFRPKPLQEVETKPKDRVEERHSSKSKSEKDIKSGHHKRHRSRSRDRHHATTETNVSRATPPSSSDIFIVDRKGDVKNLVYGSIHRYSVPPFHRYGRGWVLGASKDLRIDRDLDDGKALSLRNLNISKSGRRVKYIFARTEKEKPRLLKLRSEGAAEVHEDLGTDFVPLQSRARKRKRGEDSEATSSDSEQEARDYRSIYGKAQDQNQPQDPDLQYATESDASGSEVGRVIRLDAFIREKNARLSRKVDEFPHDINAWLELIDHQDALIGAGDDHRRVTNAEIRSTAEIKIHMYEKALEKTSSLVDRERLLQGLMAEGAKIWEVKIQADRWKQVAKENIDSLVLWTSYLNFKQSSFPSFRYEEIKELYLSRVKLLLTTVEKFNNDSTDALYQQIIYVLLRFTLFIRESGYAELSIAVWQGLLEFNLCGPSLSLSKEEHTKLFQQFWESEVPRLGEAGALGWRRYVEDEDSSDIPESATDSMHDSLQKSQIFKSWAAAERQRSRYSRMPARTMDEVVEDDPFRVILFSDIEPFLILVPFNLRSLCVDAFLIFCGLAPVSSHHQEPRNWYIDQFIRNDLLDWSIAAIEQNFSKMEPDDTEAHGLKASFQVMCPDALVSSSSRIIADTSQKSMGWQDIYSGDNSPVSYQFVGEALKQLTQTSFTEDLAQYHIAFEYKNRPETIKKVARGLLKQHPSSLKLYNAYALIEWSRSNKEAAIGVFFAALSMDETSSKTESNPDSILLWRSLTWCCLEDFDKHLALKHLLSIPDGVPNSGVALSPAALLRAKQHLTSSRDFLLSSGDLEHAMLYAECLALLMYLTGASDKEPTSASQGDITTAFDSFASFSETLATRRLTYYQELFLQSAARLLIYHCNNGPYRPSLVRSHLTSFLTLFPRNTLFLSLYTANEARLRVDNRVRSLFILTILTSENDCLTSRLFAIQHEIYYGTIHSVKSAFEKAVLSPTSRSSSGLWKFYLIWTSQNEKHLSKNSKLNGLAKDIWYRALRACPWTKELYVLGFELLGGDAGMDFRELRSTWKIMGEKELRVHVDLEEEFEDIEESQKQEAIGHK